MSGPPVSWTTAFLDLAAEHDGGLAFWSAVTGYAASPAQGERAEFHSLLPPRGDDHLGVQRPDEGPGRIHLDLHVTDPRSAADAALDLGATEVHAYGHGYVVLRSPGGPTFCFVDHAASQVTPPATWSGGGRSVVDQVCLDVAPAAYDEECAFWAVTTGRAPVGSATSPEFVALPRPASQPLRLLLQRLASDQPSVTAHLDLAVDDRPAEVRRHQELGAEVAAHFPGWTVLVDPTGARYCVTDRDPDRGRVR